MRHRVLLAFGLFVAVAGCVPLPTGPIFGQWRGSTPGPYVGFPKIVELVLDGAPDATAGRYHVAITVQNPQNGNGSGTNHWQGNWTGDQEVVGGESMRIIQLHDMLDGEVSRYQLAADGTLRPVMRADQPAHTYSAAQIAPYTLTPLSRNSWNYGID